MRPRIAPLSGCAFLFLVMNYWSRTGDPFTPRRDGCPDGAGEGWRDEGPADGLKPSTTSVGPFNGNGRKGRKKAYKSGRAHSRIITRQWRIITTWPVMRLHVPAASRFCCRRVAGIDRRSERRKNDMVGKDDGRRKDGRRKGDVERGRERERERREKAATVVHPAS